MGHALGLAVDLLYHLVPDHLDLGVVEGPLLEDGRCPQLAAPVDEVHLLRITREVVGLLHRGVAATHHGQNLAFEECPVTHGTVGHAAPRVLLLAGDVQLPRRATGGDDHRRSRVGLVELGLHVEVPFVPLRDGLDGIHDDLRAELERVIGHLLGQVRTLDALEADVILDEVGVQHLAAGHAPLDDQGLEHAAPRVHRRAQPGGTTAHNDHVMPTMITSWVFVSVTGASACLSFASPRRRTPPAAAPHNHCPGVRVPGRLPKLSDPAKRGGSRRRPAFPERRTPHCRHGPPVPRCAGSPCRRP